jgi:hypothetical protein
LNTGFVSDGIGEHRLHFSAKLRAESRGIEAQTLGEEPFEYPNQNVHAEEIASSTVALGDGGSKFNETGAINAAMVMIQLLMV